MPNEMSTDKTENKPPLPALRRDLDPIPFEHEGKPMFALKDPERLNEKTMALSPGGLLVAYLLDGQRSAADVQAVVTKQTGSVLAAAEIINIVKELERAELLETAEVKAKREAALREFLDGTVRKAAIQEAGGYPAGGLELAQFMGKFFRDPKGPGKPLADKPSLGAAPLGLISPHIDLHRGGPAYAWSYGALAEHAPPDLVIALGVAHASPNSPWVLTSKNYSTPYGPMTVDAEASREIEKSLWYNAREDEWVHRREHSLEFQALWLKFLWRDKTPPWVPILCSAFDRFCPDSAPSGVPTVEEAIVSIGKSLAGMAKKRRIMILAGVDLAHVGPRFGDEVELNAELEKKIETEDRASLEHVLKLDADAFYLSTVAGGHWRKVCGLSALYTSLRWIKALAGSAPVRGELLSYGQAPDPSGGIVSFTSGIFTA